MLGWAGGGDEEGGGGGGNGGQAVRWYGVGHFVGVCTVVTVYRACTLLYTGTMLRRHHGN